MVRAISPIHKHRWLSVSNFLNIYSLNFFCIHGFSFIFQIQGFFMHNSECDCMVIQTLLTWVISSHTMKTNQNIYFRALPNILFFLLISLQTLPQNMTFLVIFDLDTWVWSWHLLHSCHAPWHFTFIILSKCRIVDAMMAFFLSFLSFCVASWMPKWVIPYTYYTIVIFYDILHIPIIQVPKMIQALFYNT